MNNGIAGLCQSNNYCSFPDPGCDSGQRYAEHAPSGFAEECVPPTVAGTDADTEMPEGSGSAGMSGGDAESCIEVELGSELGEVDTRTFAEEDDDMSPSCGYGEGKDVVYGFTAPTTGTYRFSASGGITTSVIVTLRESCTGSELVCAENLFDPFSSSTEWDLEAGERIVVVVDTDAGEDGQFQLEIVFVA